MAKSYVTRNPIKPRGWASVIHTLVAARAGTSRRYLIRLMNKQLDKISRQG